MHEEDGNEMDKRITDLESLNSHLENIDKSENNFYISDIPDLCKEYPCVLGIDEAGRGPVLGPMVYGTAFCPINEMGLLATLQCADSKTLNEDTRDNIFKDICKNSLKIGWAVQIISPNVICNSMLSRTKYSLNQVSMDAAISLIKAAIEKGVKIEHIYVDTVGPPEKYQSYLKSLFPKYKITVAKKADSTYPIVSAASICAKVTRDHALQSWKLNNIAEESNEDDFGSGYPNDPNTKKFLAKYCDPVFGYTQFVRFSWSTAVNSLKEHAYHVEYEIEEEASPAKKNHSITSFFNSTNDDCKKDGKLHKFFTERGLCTTKQL